MLEVSSSQALLQTKQRAFVTMTVDIGDEGLGLLVLDSAGKLPQVTPKESFQTLCGY